MNYDNCFFDYDQNPYDDQDCAIYQLSQRLSFLETAIASGKIAQGPAGVKGETGATGATGPKGLTGFEAPTPENWNKFVRISSTGDIIFTEIAGSNAGSVPEAEGYNAWNFDPAIVRSSTIVKTGELYLARIVLQKQILIKDITYSIYDKYILDDGENFIGVYNSQGNLVAQTDDLSALWSTTNGVETVPLRVPVTVGKDGESDFILVAFLCNGSQLFGIGFGGNGESFENTISRSESMPARFSTFGMGLAALPQQIPIGAGIQKNSEGIWVAV